MWVGLRFMRKWDRQYRNKGYRDRNHYLHIRETILERYGYKCLWCGDMERLEMDHIVPRSRGGPTELSNLQPLCQRCNGKKGCEVIDFRSSNDPNRIYKEVPRTEPVRRRKHKIVEECDRLDQEFAARFSTR